MLTLLAALSAAAAAVLLIPGRRTLPIRSPAGPSAGRAPALPLVPVLVVAGAGLGVLITMLDGVRLLLAVVLTGCAAASARVVRRHVRAREARTRRARVVDVCEALVGELRAGQPVAAGLERCVQMWAELAPVAGACRLGADVPTALRRLSRLEGAEDLADVAAAWQVSERSGAGLATALGQVAQSARAREATRLVVQGELASAQATARLVAALPVASLAMSAGIGADPWHFLLATPAGVACLAAGAALAFAGLAWIDRIAAGVLRGTPQ